MGKLNKRVIYLESLLSTRLDVSFFGLNDNTVFVHSVSFGHIFVTEEPSVSNICGPYSSREEKESNDT